MKASSGSISRSVQDVYPMSMSQRGILLHSLSAPGSGMYIGQSSWRLSGAWDIDNLKRAWKLVVGRHDVLRTAFDWDEADEPLQLVFDKVELPWLHLDWRHYSHDEQERRLSSLLESDRQKDFNLSQAPLIRFTVAQLSESEHQLIWTHHHAIVDGWSIQLLLKDVAVLYQKLCSGQSTWQAAAPQYRNYIAWLQKQDFDVCREAWRRQLGDLCDSTLEGLGHHRTDLPQSELNGAQHLVLGADTTRRLRALASRRHITLNAICQAAFAIVLRAYSGKENVVFGVVVSGRPPILSRSDEIVGLFINTLPLRINVRADGPIGDLLYEVHANQAFINEQQHISLPVVLSFFDMPSGQQPFESVYVFQNFPASRLEAHGTPNTTVEDLSLNERTHYPLTVVVSPGLETDVKFSYSRRRFSDGLISDMVRHYASLLEQLETSLVGSIAALLQTEAEQELLLRMSAGREIRCDADENNLSDFLLRQAERTPEAIAVFAEEGHLSYGELNARANQLARYLRRNGVRPEVRVGICQDRSLELIISLVGTLKSGGCYMPMDSEYPQERLAWMRDDSGASVFLTKDTFAELDAENREDVRSGARPENLLYVIYTSGSTGRPKGAMNTHRSVINRLLWMQQQYSLSADDRVLQKTSSSFDVSVWEFFWPLMTGACMVLARPGGNRHPEYIGNLIEQDQITVSHFVPSMLTAFVGAYEVERLKTLKWVICSGELLSGELENEVRRRMNARLENLYGPTEAAVDVSWWACDGTVGDIGVPIGRPINNTRLYVLDSERRLTPIGAAGELCIGGIAPGRGYLNRAGLTAERFVPDPYSKEKGSRMYRTGDRARWRQEGVLEYLGRMDKQVKIRGYRIEPGEIEAEWGKHGGVGQCVVTVKEEGRGGKRLVGYWTEVKGGKTTTVREMREYLAERLPGYMVPAILMKVEEMPLMGNGKIDWKRLPEAEIETGEGYQAARTPVEQVLVGIFEQVLGLKGVSTKGNFFELGGHSLQATQVGSRVRQSLGVDLPLQAIFEKGTVEELAKRVEEERKGGKGREEKIERRKERRGVLSYAQERMWFLNQMEPKSAAYHIPAGLRLKGRLDEESLRRSLGEIERRHEALRTRYEMKEGIAAQEVKAWEGMGLGVVDVSGLEKEKREEEVKRQSEEEGKEPFDLRSGKLWRTRLIKEGEEEHVLLMTMHHIASDGWSIGIMVKELSEWYGALVGGRDAKLKDLHIQYMDFAAWQREWLERGEMERQMAYWKKQLENLPTMELEVDRGRRAVKGGKGGRVRVGWGEEVRKRMEEVSREYGVTPFMTLAAVFAVLLHRYSGEKGVVIGTPIANRTREETEGLIGCFVNTLVLRVEVERGARFVDVLRRVREVSVEGYMNQDVPFEKLVEELQPERDLSRHPLFQVMFVLQNAPMGELRLGELELEPLNRPLSTAKFDLSLDIMETTCGLLGMLEYDAGLFEEEAVEKIGEQYGRLLESVLADVEARVADLELLGKEEKEQMLEEWNGKREEWEEKRTEKEVERQAERRGDAIAVVSGADHLSYGELNARANQLAHYLRKKGVGADVRVGICMERSAELVTGIVGILKAGGAYVPLDPNYPNERLEWMLKDACCQLVLAHHSSIHVAENLKAEFLLIDAETAILNQSRKNGVVLGRPGNLAYVIYTSGSTGTPKGVQIEHRALINLLCSMRREPGCSMDDTLLAVTSSSFDIAGLELFLPLITGSKVVIAERYAVGDGHALRDRLSEQNITVMQATPATWRLLLSAGWEGKTDLKILCGGEPLTPDLAEGLLPRCAELWNMYGPTETTVWSSCTRITSANEIHIGRPISNTDFYILGTGLQLMPTGVVGELLVGGQGVARGYLNRPELTAENFIPNPFKPGASLYRTGDLAKYRPDGDVVCLGRMDCQVKVRGHRVELGEIEAVLGEMPEVKQAVVIFDDEQLIAYYRSQSEEPVASSIFREFVRAKLPDYMAPVTYVHLDAIPLTPNGKVDRKQLAESGLWQSCKNYITYLAPRDIIEYRLAKIWREILTIPGFGVSDNFFEVGGNSLSAVRLLGKVRAEFGEELPLLELFGAATIEQQAKLLRRRQASRDYIPSLVSIQPLGSKRPFYCIHPAGGTVLCFAKLAAGLASARPLVGLQAAGLYGECPPIGTVEGMAERYIREILNHQPTGPFLLGGYSSGGLVAFEIAQQLIRSGQEVGVLALIDTMRPLREATDMPSDIHLLAEFLKPLPIPVDTLESMCAIDQLKHVLRIAKEYRAIPDDIDPIDAERLLAVLKQNLRASWRYNPSYYPGTIHLFSAMGQTQPRMSKDWREYAEDFLEVPLPDAQHDDILSEPHVQVLAKKLSDVLDAFDLDIRANTPTL